MPKKICLLSDLHLSINPRVWKEAFVYEAMGYEVVVLTQWISDQFLARDQALLAGHQVQYRCYLDIRPGVSSSWTRTFYRGRRRIAVTLQRWLGLSLVPSISYAPERLLRFALREQADLYVAHVEAGFWAGRKLHQQGKLVGFDLEDWHSRDYPGPERPVNLLHQLEGYALKQGAFFTTTSAAMARALQACWHSDRKIGVLYNSFPGEEIRYERSPVRPGDACKLVWTSRTIGPHRGLETLLEAISLIQAPLELHIIGQITEDYKQELQDRWAAKPGHKLVLYDFVSHQELQQLLASFHVGIAVELTSPESRDKTITNKILQYIQAGLRVLATDTQGQQEIADLLPGSVFTVPVGQPAAWARTLETMIGLLAQPYQAQQQEVYDAVFSWPVQAQKIQANAQAFLG